MTIKLVLRLLRTIFHRFRSDVIWNRLQQKVSVGTRWARNPKNDLDNIWIISYLSIAYQQDKHKLYSVYLLLTIKEDDESPTHTVCKFNCNTNCMIQRANYALSQGTQLFLYFIISLGPHSNVMGHEKCNSLLMSCAFSWHVCAIYGNRTDSSK